MQSLRNYTYRDQRPFTSIFGEDWPSGINECGGSQRRSGHPDLHGILDIGLLQSVSDDPKCLFNPSPEGEG